MSYSSPSTRWAQTLMFLAVASPLAAHATDQVTLQPVEVTTSKAPVALRDTPTAVTVISGAELRARGAHDLRTALSQVAGVSIAPGGDAGPASAVPSLWGLREFDAFLLVVDGVPAGGAHAGGSAAGAAAGCAVQRQVERIQRAARRRRGRLQPRGLRRRGADGDEPRVGASRRRAVTRRDGTAIRAAVRLRFRCRTEQCHVRHMPKNISSRDG